MTMALNIRTDSKVTVTFLGSTPASVQGLLRHADDFGIRLWADEKVNYIPWTAVGMLTIDSDPETPEPDEEN